mmetsp:Transcript_2134/g.4825  ORF Transcript_2134/g.4825 Transcript_2134/m.4825 type:complete len:282 (-) Transcript_2134:132-977(-)
MEVTREPGLDRAVLTDKFNELSALDLVGVVQPAASVDNVVLLKNTKSGSVRGSMGEDKDLPSFIGRVSLDDVLEPVNLFLVDGDFVRSVLGLTEDGGSHTNQQGLFGNLAHELRSILVVSTQEEFQVGLIGVKFINSLKIVVSSNDIVWNAKATKEVSGKFVTFSSSSKEFRSLVRSDRLGFSKISQRNDRDLFLSNVCLGLIENVQPLRAASFIVFHDTRINVKISENSNTKFISRSKERSASGLRTVQRVRNWLKGHGFGAQKSQKGESSSELHPSTIE